MGPGGSQMRRSGVTTTDRRDDVAHDELAKRRREQTKTASWSAESWRVTQSEQKRQAEGAGTEWGQGRPESEWTGENWCPEVLRAQGS